MAAPSFIGASPGLVTTGTSLNLDALITGKATGDLYIAQIMADGTPASDPTYTGGGTNIANLAGTLGAFTAITPAGGQPLGINGKQFLFAARIVGFPSNLNFTVDGGIDHYGRLYLFRDVNTGATLADILENGTAGTIVNATGTTAAVTDTAVTTIATDRLALQFVGVDDDNPLAPFAGMTGGVWVEAVAEFASATGTDGAIQLQLGHIGGSSVLRPGTTIDSSLGNAASTTRKAAKFTAPATGTITLCQVSLAAVGVPTDDLVVEIRNDSAGTPSGALVGTAATLDITSTTRTSYTAAVAATVTSGNVYWVVFRRTGATDAANYYTVESGSGGTGLAIFDGASWSTSAGSYAHLILVGSGTAGTIDGGTQTMAAADNWGVIGFALKPLPSGPTTHYGVTSSAYTFAKAVAGQKQTYGATATPLTVAIAVAGQVSVPAVTHYGALAAPFAFNAAVAGQRKAFGATANPYTFAAVTAAQRKTFGVTATPLTFSKAVAAQRKTFGALAAPFTFQAATAGIATTGAVTHYGQLVAPFAFASTTQAKRRTTSSTAMPVTFAAVTQTRRRTTSSLAAPFAFSAVVASRKQYARTTTTITFGAAIQASKKTYGVVARPITFGAVTAGIGFTGAATHFGATSTSITFSKAVQGTKKTFGVVARPIVFAAVVQGRRTTKSQVAAVYTFARLVQAQRKTHAQIAMPIQWLAVTRGVSTVGIQTYYGVVARPITFTAVVQAKRRTTSTVAMPITFSAFTKGMLMAAILNYADDIRWGTIQADRVMVGTEEVWRPGDELVR